MRSPNFVLVLAVGVAVAVAPGAAAVKVRSNFDKAFDFKQARTWAWAQQNAGQVVAARTQRDDPEAIKSRAEPIIMSAVETEMPRRGLKPALGAPDLTLAYFLLLTIGTSTQTLGQFLPATVDWGIPPFAPSTTSFEVIEQGSLVLDLSADGKVVWRGIGEAKIDLELDQEKRAELIREAVREILERYPPRQ